MTGKGFSNPFSIICSYMYHNEQASIGLNGHEFMLLQTGRESGITPPVTGLTKHRLTTTRCLQIPDVTLRGKLIKAATSEARRLGHSAKLVDERYRAQLARHVENGGLRDFSPAEDIEHIKTAAC